MKALLLATALTCTAVAVQAKPMSMVESRPVASAVIGTRSNEFLVRFDGPVDHRRSTLTITQNGQVVETLHPRLESSPSVLFARSQRLAPGDYMLHWNVVSLQGSDVTEGDIPFRVQPE
jgi:methionine-rich copper-binding protein CopC